MKRLFNFFSAALLSLGLIVSPPALATVSSLPDEPQAQSPATRLVQADIEDKAADKANEKRKQILADAAMAIDETKKALQALEDNDTRAAMDALELATGKLELILARDPALAPVDVRVESYDLLASADTVKAVIHDAENYLEDGEVQKARRLVSKLASEVVFRTTSIPLATYPNAIKAVIPLIDAGRSEEAREGLQAALNTLVVTTDDVIPLPVLRAEHLLKKAEALVKNEERTVKDNETLADLLVAARSQLEMAELLGYGTKKSFQPMYKQLDMIEEKTADGDSGKGLFNRIRQQVSQLF